MIKQFSITGMTCAACSSGIERTVKKLEGVRACEVSLMGESMRVDFNEALLTSEKIISAVFALGYGAYDYGKAPQKKKQSVSPLFLRFIISVVLLVPLMYFSMGGMIGLPVPGGWWNHGFQLGITTVILAVNYKFFTSGVRAAVKLVPNMDTLITVGSAAAYIYSLVVLILHHTSGDMGGMDMAGMELNLFFESAATIVTLVTLGKWLEDRSKARTGREIEKLLSLAPDIVTVERGGEECKVPLSEVEAGDTVIVRQGESVAVDGTVLEGHAFVDQAAITGESLPVELSQGSRAMSASLVTSGYLKIKAEKVGEDTMLAGIIRMVREAGASKAPIQKLADKVAAVFVPVVVAIALVTFAVWMIVTREFSDAINYAVSVLVISCPCALGLATPVAIMAATGRGASLGILYKNAEALQRMSTVREVLLDKTATITEGRPKVVHFRSEIDAEEAKAVAYALEIKLNHPLAQCVVEYCERGYDAEKIEYIVGQGARGKVNGKTYYLGNDRMLQAIGVKFETQLEEFEKLSAEGKTVLFLADEKQVLALFALADTLKEGSRAAVSALLAQGKRPFMLTGDNEACAKYIAREAGIDENSIYAQVLPQDKLRIVQECRNAESVVAMVGDGINDSPALKEADVGIAMGNGTDVAIESADAVLVSGDIAALPRAFALSKRTMRIIKQNLFWAFFYNCIGIPLAAGVFAWAGISLDPMIAALAMSLSSLFVVGNALRLIRFGRSAQLKNHNKGVDNMKKTIFVEGMACEHCAKRVKEALEGVAGVEKADIKLKKKLAAVKLSAEVSDEALTAAVTAAGYEVKGIE